MARIYRNSDGKVIGSSTSVTENTQALGLLVLVFAVGLLIFFSPIGASVVTFRNGYYVVVGEPSAQSLAETYFNYFYCYVLGLPGFLVSHFYDMAVVPPNANKLLSWIFGIGLTLGELALWGYGISKFPRIVALVYTSPLLFWCGASFIDWLGR